MREYVTPIFLANALNLFAQFPPIALEWSALRWYDGYPNAHITRDPVHDHYLWVVYQNFQGASDESAFPFLPDGTDLSPSYPMTFSVGSLDGLVDVAVYDSTVHFVMHHQYLSGTPQDVLWHMDGTEVHSADPYLADVGHDLLVTGDGVYSCGTSGTHYLPDSSVARVLKTDLAGNLLWNVTWADPASAWNTFTSMAVIGDTIFCAAYPGIVFLDRNTGAFIDALDFYPPGSYEMQLVAHGTRIYWAVNAGSDLLYGYHDLATNAGLNSNIPLTGLVGAPHVVMDDLDRLWIGTTVGNVGHWFRLDAEFTQLASGTLYESIDDMCFVNGKISFTGIMDSTTSTAYLITGTPQP